ncbi:hypothetical protein F5X71_13100 [Nocardia brasiliensis]|uniref:Uncharacterized protein n=1 Tax=Nocardia brasiliensis TaxID=37326 RepID=A0A6G9XQ95_NOCBR|nr:hypothetical protein [Nocardia brasiliensis]QIS03122.1 hypothetical protein F5X71_13100 [Nocardia brasiliensis]
MRPGPALRHSELPDPYRERDRISAAIGELDAARAALDNIIAATVPIEVAESLACRPSSGVADLPTPLETSAGPRF